MTEIDRLNSINPQTAIRNDRLKTQAKSKKAEKKPNQKQRKKPQDGEDHELDEYA